MKIGIIGAGNIGSTLATHFTKLQHDVSIANSRGPGTLKEVAAKTGATAATIEDALMGAEVVVVTIPMNRVKELSEKLFNELPESTVVIDTCNYYPDSRDGTIPELEGRITESAYVEHAIGHPVVKAFNNIMAPLLASRGVPPGASGRIALPFSGDDEHAKKVVMELINAIGFDPVNAGSIAESWRQQQGMPVYCTNYDYRGVREGLAIADRGRLVEMRQMNEALMMRLMARGTPEQIVEAVRELHRREDHRKAS